MEVIKGHGWTSAGMYTAWQSAVIRGDRDKDAQKEYDDYLNKDVLMANL